MPLGLYIVDLYCHEAKLAIEVDGEYHLGSSQREYDKERTDTIETTGVKIIRFTNQEILTNLADVLERIKIILKNTSPDP